MSPRGGHVSGRACIPHSTAGTFVLIAITPVPKFIDLVFVLLDAKENVVSVKDDNARVPCVNVTPDTALVPTLPLSASVVVIPLPLIVKLLTVFPTNVIVPSPTVVKSVVV